MFLRPRTHYMMITDVNFAEVNPTSQHGLLPDDVSDCISNAMERIDFRMLEFIYQFINTHHANKIAPERIINDILFKAIHFPYTELHFEVLLNLFSVDINKPIIYAAKDNEGVALYQESLIHIAGRAPDKRIFKYLASQKDIDLSVLSYDNKTLQEVMQHHSIDILQEVTSKQLHLKQR